jgi:hypothetical protein
VYAHAGLAARLDDPDGFIKDFLLSGVACHHP